MPIEVKASPIHGQGVFARVPFRKGQRIGRYVGRRTTRDGEYVLWVESEKGICGYEGTGKLRFLNHSRRPNGILDGIELFALRSIRPGDEITIHYGDDWNDV